MDRFCLESENFRLLLDFRVFEEDISYPSNTTLKVSVFSEGFSATTDMDIDVKQMFGFCENLQTIYDSLRGEAKISEAYGKQYLSFSCDRHGHIFISGYLYSCGINGFRHTMEFENVLDQSFLPSFMKDLAAFSKRYNSINRK